MAEKISYYIMEIMVDYTSVKSSQKMPNIFKLMQMPKNSRDLQMIVKSHSRNAHERMAAFCRFF